MDARYLIDEIMLNVGNMESLFEILDNSIVELDRNTGNSRDRNKIEKALNQFSVIMNALVNENKTVYKKCNALWDEVLKLEKK